MLQVLIDISLKLLLQKRDMGLCKSCLKGKKKEKKIKKEIEKKMVELNSRRHSLPKLELENLSFPLYAPIYPNLVATLS